MRKGIFISLLLLSSLINAQIVEKVEPAFWWADMEYNKIQLLVYGKNISEYSPSIEQSLVSLVSIDRSENKNYLFLNLDLSKAQVGSFQIKFSKKGLSKEFSINYELKKRKENSKNRKGFDSSDLVYLIMPDRFSNGDTANDSKLELSDKWNRKAVNGRHGGDIKGIINNLDYIKELGVTAIWNTPMCEDNQLAGSYHNYAQSDVYKIDARYGTNEDYKKLGEELHKRDMKLILDYVTNHWGEEHWMIKDLPEYSWLNQFPGYANSNYRMTTQYDINASDIDAKYCMDGWFVSEMPDLNQRNPKVLKYLIQNAIWWIEYADLDGLRVDTYSYGDKESIAKWTKTIMDTYPNFNIVGEAWLYNTAAISYWQKDSKIAAIQNYNTYLPSVMDFTLQTKLSTVFSVEEANWNTGMIEVYDNFTNDFMYPDVNNLFVFYENHDTPRFHHLYKNNAAAYKLATTLIATTRGIPQIYYGSEIGMAGDKHVADGDIRRDFPGGWETDTRNAFEKTGRTIEEQDLFSFSSKIFNWRKNKKVIHSGKMKHYIPKDNVYVYFRYDEKESVMVVINNNPKYQKIDLKQFAESIQSFTKGKSVLTDEIYNLKMAELMIKGKTSLVLELF
ncbi:glycoside hydrolase family 13 protein [Bacteroidota bacterium]